jgi:hypothetical protein
MRIVCLDPAPSLLGCGVLTPAGPGVGPILTRGGARDTSSLPGPGVPTDLTAACGEWAAALRRADRYGALGFTAARLSLMDAGVEPPSATEPSWGVATGSALGCWGSNTRHHRALRGTADLEPGPALFVRTVANSVNGDISIAWRLGGPSATFVSGWTAGAEALIAAGAALADGRARRMIAVGIESPEGPFRTMHAAARARPDGAWLPEVLAEGAAAILMDAGGRPDTPRLVAFARGRDRPGSWSLAELRRAGGMPAIGRLVVANTVPPATRDRIESEAEDLEVIDLPARTGEMGAAGAVAAVAIAVAGSGGAPAVDAPRPGGTARAGRPAGTLVLARGAEGGLVVLAVSC